MSWTNIAVDRDHDLDDRDGFSPCETIYPAKLKRHATVRFVTADGAVGTFTVRRPGQFWVEGELAGVAPETETAPARLFRQWELCVGGRPDFQLHFDSDNQCYWTGEPIILLEITSS